MSLEPATEQVQIDRRGRPVAVLLADMVEFSRRMEQDEAGSVSQVGRSLQLFRDLIVDYGGEISTIAGDGILALFDEADAALKFAIQIQSEFREQSVWGDGKPIEFRIGLNFGEVAHQGAIALGHSINVAARLQAFADPGGILLTGAFRSAIRNMGGLSLRSLGQPHLKNISGPVEVFAVEAIAVERGLASVAPREVPAGEPVRHPTIAVLALTNLSGDRRNDHLCEGIAEDIIANLTRFRNIMVIARHSAFMFNLKSNPAPVVRRELGARYILAGSLRRSDRRLRIAVELIDAMTETALWSDRFNVELEELFDLQDEIAGKVASRLSSQIDFAERRQESPHPRDMRSYGLVLRGQHLALKFTRETNWHARRLFEEAIELAPEYSRGYSALSRTHNLDWRYQWSSNPGESLEAAIMFARQATSFDSLDARGFAELGCAKLYSRQHDEAIADYVQALTLNPNDSDIIAEYADALVYAEKPERSIELLQQAMRLNPYYPDWYLWYMADAYDAMGRYEDVIATVKRMHDPGEGQRLLAVSYAHLGKVAEAQAAAREVQRLHPRFSIGAWRDRPPYRNASVLERYIDGLRKAGLPE